MKKIVLYGHFGSGNIGNDSSFEAALYHVKKYQPDANIICVCNGPKEITRRFGIQAVSMSGADADTRHSGRLLSRITRLFSHVRHEITFWLSRPRWFQPGDQFIVVGTGAVDDMGVRRPWHAPYELYKWCKAAKLGGAKVIFLSVGVGPIVKRVNRILMLKALQMADYRSYREVAAFNYLQSLGYDTTGDLLYPDLVFSLPKASLPIPRNSSSGPKVVGLGLIHYNGWQPGTEDAIYQEYVSKVKQFASWLLCKGFMIRVICGDIADWGPVQALVEFVNKEGESHWKEMLTVEEISDVNGLFNQIAQTDIVVASRFHNVLCALMIERPVISLGYHEKNDLMMKGMGLENYCQHVEHFTYERLIEQFSSCVQDADQITRQIHDQLGVYRDLLDDQYKKLFS